MTVLMQTQGLIGMTWWARVFIQHARLITALIHPWVLLVKQERDAVDLFDATCIEEIQSLRRFVNIQRDRIDDIDKRVTNQIF